MSDVFLEIIRAIIVSIIFVSLCYVKKKEKIGKQTGLSFVLVGFGFVLFGMIIDITDEFSSLDKFVVLGDTPIQALLEKVVGYLIGFLLIAIGFWKWLPTIILLKVTKGKLKEANATLGLKVKELTAMLKSVNKKLLKKIEEYNVAKKRRQELEDQLINSAEDGGYRSSCWWSCS